MLAMALILIGILARLFPHVPNFAPVVAIALFSGVYLNKKYAPWLALGLMVLSDLMIGMHNVFLFTWASVVLIAYVGIWLKKHKSVATMLGGGLLSSILFFIISNFGVWFMGWYPRTMQGLINCYVMAIPFFRTSLISDLAYIAVMFSVYELVALKIKNTKLAPVLLLKS